MRIGQGHDFLQSPDVVGQSGLLNQTHITLERAASLLLLCIAEE